MSNDPSREPNAPTPAADVKAKPYAAPKLRVYGDAAELTRTAGNGSMMADGGSMAFSKTV